MRPSKTLTALLTLLFAITFVDPAFAFVEVGPFGSTGGAYEGPGNDGETEVVKIDTWANGDYVYGIKLYYADGTSKMFGDNVHTKVTRNLSGGDYIKRIDYYIDLSGYLRGLQFTPAISSVFSIGNVSSLTKAFGPKHFTDMKAWVGTVSGETIIWGVAFQYIP